MSKAKIDLNPIPSVPFVQFSDGRMLAVDTALARVSRDDGTPWTARVIVAKNPTVPGDTGSEHRISYPYGYEHESGEIWVATGQGKLRMKLRETDFVET